MEERDVDSFRPGSILLGKYRVDENLGTGGMGRVVRASHLYLQQSVAIKILLPQMADSPSTVARFLREAQAVVRLKSEHTARVIDVGTLPEGTPFMIMEYLEGNDLNQILRHHGPQQPNVVCDLLLQACEGLAEAHALGIVHRDIKPSNFFITHRPDGSMLLKILDFGISKTRVDHHELTATQTVIGTPSYMAPEQMKSGKLADSRSDIWSLGVVMYQLLQGRPPFAGETYAELVLKVNAEPPTPLHVPLPPGLGEVILRTLEKDPYLRQQNVGELARMLAPFATDPVVAAQIATRTTRILQQRASAAGLTPLPISAGGGLATPVPLSPAQLTPRSWPPSSTSLAQGKGEMTRRVGTSKGWFVAGALALVILAGVGGFVVSNVVKDGEDGTRAASEPARVTPTTTEPPRPGSAASTPAPTQSTIAPAAQSAKTATPDATKAATPDATKAATPDATKKAITNPDATKATPDATKTATKKPATKKPSTKTETKKPAKKPEGGGLFDSRH